jgi:hypothetical protein
MSFQLVRFSFSLCKIDSVDNLLARAAKIRRHIRHRQPEAVAKIIEFELMRQACHKICLTVLREITQSDIEHTLVCLRTLRHRRNYGSLTSSDSIVICLNSLLPFTNLTDECLFGVVLKCEFDLEIV